MQFKDDNGQAWQMKVSVGALLAIKRELGVNLLDMPGQIPTSLETLFSCVWICCYDEIQSRGLSEVDFAKLMNGPALGLAVDAFISELADFHDALSPDKAAALRTVWALTKDASKLSTEQVNAIFGTLPAALAKVKRPHRKPRQPTRKKAKARA